MVTLVFPPLYQQRSYAWEVLIAQKGMEARVGAGENPCFPSQRKMEKGEDERREKNGAMSTHPFSVDWKLLSFISLL